MAAQVEVMGRDEIRASGATTTQELLEKRANVFVRNADNPVTSQVSMRGYGANGFGRVKIIVDGEELNNPDMAAQNLMRIPMNAIRRVEILHGPQTVLQGGEATAGVINILTDRDSYEEKREAEVHGGSWGRVGVHAGASGGSEEDRVTYFADFDYDRSDGWRKNSWYDLWSTRGGVKKHFANGGEIGMKLFYSDSQYGLPGGLYGDWKAKARTALDTESRAKNDIYGVNLTFDGSLNDENHISGELNFRNRKSESYGYLDYDVYTIDGKLKYTNEAKIGGMDNQFDIGIERKLDLLYADAYNARYKTGGDNDYIRISGALFARDELYFTDEVSAYLGLRGMGYYARDRYHGNGTREKDSETSGDWAAELGVNYRPDDDTKIFARGTRFYHTPLADELFSSYGVPNMGLDPESGYNLEIGIDRTMYEHWNINFTGFHSGTTDEILYMNGGNRNAPDDTMRDGFETSLTWSKKKTGSAGILYSYTYARFSEGVYERKDLPMVPRQLLRVFGEAYIIDELAINGGYRFIGEQRYGGDFANEGGRLDDYGIFDCGFRIECIKGLTIAFTIDNLFDKRYANYGEYVGTPYVYPASGRCYMLSVRYEW